MERLGVVNTIERNLCAKSAAARLFASTTGKGLCARSAAAEASENTGSTDTYANSVTLTNIAYMVDYGKYVRLEAVAGGPSANTRGIGPSARTAAGNDANTVSVAIFARIAKLPKLLHYLSCNHFNHYLHNNHSWPHPGARATWPLMRTTRNSWRRSVVVGYGK